MLITLLTDFGLKDGYVGVMKGVIKKINYQAEIIDLSHDIPPQNLLATRFILDNSVDYFPSGTIYVIVVDPTVGSEREGIVIKNEKGYFICPNNGILSGILENYKTEKIYDLTNKKYWRSSKASNTFHGRDIFAPVSAYLSRGITIEELGKPVNSDNLITLNLSKPKLENSKIIGKIQYIDIFGNLITNIPIKMLEGRWWYVQINNKLIYRQKNYSAVEKGELLAIKASHGYLEIASNRDNAQQILQQNYDDEIEVIFQ